jgi:hypothetical protein
MALMVDSGAWWKLIHEKNLKSKFSWPCPFNVTYVELIYSINVHNCTFKIFKNSFDYKKYT